jgi:hypothetical protein
MASSFEAERIRIQHQYKRLVLLDRVRLPLAAARRLIGPDCAFHLYARGAEQVAVRGTRRRRRMHRSAAG